MSLNLFVSCLKPPRRTTAFKASPTWWATQVVCVTVEEVPEVTHAKEGVRFYSWARGRVPVVLKATTHKLTGSPEGLVRRYLDKPIVAFTESRQHFWSFQPSDWITYHVSTILEVEGPGSDKLFILIERVDDRLEVMLGLGAVTRTFLMEFRATGKCRQTARCFQQPRQLVAPRVTVRRLFEWLGNSLARRWQPYHMLQNNCQHVADEVQQYVRDPRGAGPIFLTEPQDSASGKALRSSGSFADSSLASRGRAASFHDVGRASSQAPAATCSGDSTGSAVRQRTISQPLPIEGDVETCAVQ